jgi:hypothetical protein
MTTTKKKMMRADEPRAFFDSDWNAYERIKQWSALLCIARHAFHVEAISGTIAVLYQILTYQNSDRSALRRRCISLVMTGYEIEDVEELENEIVKFVALSDSSYEIYAQNIDGLDRGMRRGRNESGV